MQQVLTISEIQEYISKAYKEINMIPINGQEKIVESILTDFFINGKRNVVCSLDTGFGKSIIGAIVAKIFSYVFDEGVDDKGNDYLPSMIVVHSNSLVKQYGETFNKFPPIEFHQIIGASNYHCEAATALSKENTPATGEDCFERIADEHIKKKYCMDCEFKRAKSHINTTNCLITNYSYHFISRMASNHLIKRKLVVFDEAHNVSEVFCEHNTIHVSVKNLERYIDETKLHFAIETKSQRKVLRDIRDQLNDDLITESNYVSTIKSLREAYKGIAKIFKDKNIDKSDVEKYMKLNRISKKYEDLASKIGDLLIYKYDHAFDGYDPTEKKYGKAKNDNKEFFIKPIFVDKMGNKIMSEYNLFMSATISDEYMITTMGLKREETSFIKLPPIYDPENKTVAMIGEHRLNFNSLKDPNVIASLKESVKMVLEDAHQDGYKGLIITPSFAMGDMFIDCIPRGMRLFHHKSGMKIDSIIKDFKEYEGGSAVLVSPSIFEGLDFKDDYSRFQILTKCPYPSLADKRMKYISKNYPEIYRIMTLMKIVQAIGRSVRNKDDWAVTVVTDLMITDLFKSHLNVWRNQFNVI